MAVNYPSTSGSTNNAALNTPLQSKLLKVEVERNTYFVPLANDMSLWNRGDEVKPGIVMRKDEFIKEGYDEIRIPKVLRLQNDPIYGDAQGEGNEEAQRFRYFSQKVNQIKHQAISSGRTASRRLKQVNPFKVVRKQMRQYFAKVLDIEFFRALAYGWSNNLLASEANHGLYVNSGTKVSHPNLFVAGYTGASDDSTYPGLVAWSATPATYETNAAVCIAAQGTDSAAWCSPQLFDRLIPHLELMEIEPLDGVIINGLNMYALLLHTQQWQQMVETNGSLYKVLETVDSGMGAKSAIFTGAKYIYKNFIIHVSGNVPGVYSSGSALTYGYASSMTRDTYNNRMGFILGQDALAYGVAENLGFVDRDVDYKSWDAVQARCICGMGRVDWARDDGASWTTRLGKNTSSIAFATYSPVGSFTSASTI